MQRQSPVMQPWSCHPRVNSAGSRSLPPLFYSCISSSKRRHLVCSAMVGPILLLPPPPSPLTRRLRLLIGLHALPHLRNKARLPDAPNYRSSNLRNTPILANSASSSSLVGLGAQTLVQPRPWAVPHPPSMFASACTQTRQRRLQGLHNQWNSSTSWAPKS